PDQVYFTAVSEAFKRITGIENVPMHRTPEGAFFQYGYFQFGVPSFSTLGWGLPADTTRGRSGPSPQADSPEEPAAGRAGGAEVPPGGGAIPGARGGGGGQAAPARGGGAGAQAGGSSGTDKGILSALDAANIDAFSDWAPFQHPELGNVEIGGFLPYLTHNPPAEQLPELGKKHGEFLVELAGMLPRVRIAATKVTAHGGGVFTVTVDVENAGFLPTSLRHGQTSRSVGATFLQIQIDDDDILSGAEKTTDVGTLNGSGTRGESVTWVIWGREGAQLEIKLYSQKSGRDAATVTLR
ncbi:MAG: hypothetical protein ABIF09_01705, partial [Gemmatimonadota bacterium]